MSNPSLKEQLEAATGRVLPKDAPKKAVNPNFPPRQDGFKNNKPTKDSKPESSQPNAKVLPKKPKPQWLDYVQYGVELLKLYFPNTFKGPNELVPLKVGIKQDLLLKLSTLEQIATDDKACMVKSLAFYVNTAGYHKSAKAGAERVDLEGAPAGVVTEEEAKYSLDRKQAKQQAKEKPKEETEKKPS